MASEKQIALLLSDIAHVIVAGFPIPDALTQLVDRSVEILPIAAAGMTVTSAGADPWLIAASDDRARQLEELQAHLGRGPGTMSTQNAAPVVLPDLGHDRRFPAFSSRALDAGLFAVFSFPLSDGCDLVGAMDLFGDAPGSLDEGWMAAARALADVASAYLTASRRRAAPGPAPVGATERTDRTKPGVDGSKDSCPAGHRPPLESDLHGAAARGELYVHYQPIVAATDGSILGVEALLRWLHPTRGLVSPATLIPLAEKSDTMVEIGRWVLEQSLVAGKELRDLGTDGGLTMSVNVSACQLGSAHFVDTVEEVLARSQTEPRLLTLEVTESMSVGDTASGILNDLKRLGVRVALDDFGTGCSSLSDIARFPVDIIKVDRAFVAGLGEDSASTTIVRSVIELAHGLGMTVVAEGVETAVQLIELARLGCDTYQGFYFAPPMSVAQLVALSHDAPAPAYGSLVSPSVWDPSATRTGGDLTGLRA